MSYANHIIIEEYYKGNQMAVTSLKSSQYSYVPMNKKNCRRMNIAGKMKMTSHFI